MYDKKLVFETLQQIEEVIHRLMDGTKSIDSVNELLTSSDGMLRLNGICMCLLVIGEEFKKIDHRTNRQLLSLYPSISWREVIGMRDRIAHHYFDIDADVVFDILRHDIPPLLSVINQIKQDLEIEYLKKQ
jgi:uncharacterized protein with HEPN domain